jgi:sec-independent protein translocase protein TatA
MRIGPLGVWEILIILTVVLIVFGPSRLPQMAKGVGQAVREFRKGVKDMKDEFVSEVEEKPTKPAKESASDVA